MRRFKRKYYSSKTMAVDECVTQTYPIKCKGRDKSGNEVLSDAVSVEVEIYQRPGSNTILSIVQCQYTAGGHGERCKASHPDVDKVWKGVGCPYSFYIPYAPEIRK